MSNLSLAKNDAFVSVILAASEIESGANVKNLYDYLDSRYIDYEIVIIENQLNARLRKELKTLLSQVKSTRFIELAFEIDYEKTVAAGLENCIGDYVIVFNLQRDPLDTIAQMIKLSQDKNEVIVGISRNTRSTLSYKFIRPLVRKALYAVGYNIPQNATSLRCLSRSAVNSTTRARNYHHQIFIRIANCGFETYQMPYTVINSQKKNLTSAVFSTFRIMIFNSTKPLRWMSMLGMFGCLVSLIFATYSFIVHFVNNNVADGWSSIVIIISFLFMILFTILSFFGEYLGRILDTQSLHSPYWVLNEHNSSVMADSNRNNVTDKSTF